jgi:quinoprotein dehydrogenase-associated probable ABC transporter substrate-binding protein
VSAVPQRGAVIVFAVAAAALALAAARSLAQSPPAQSPPAPAAENPELSLELIDPKVLRVCADPRNMPFSTEAREGFENKIAALFAEKLGKSLAYTWYPGSTGFVRNTLGAYRCDVIMGMPQGDDIVQVTNPYYHTAYALVFKPGTGLDGIDSLADPRLKGKHIGVVAGTPPASYIAANGLMSDARPYPLFIDTRFDSSAAKMIEDLERGDIDAAALWGPMAGYYAGKLGAAATMVPLVKDKGGPPLAFRIGMGVRYTDQEWKRILNRMIQENQPAITRILLGYGIPLLDEKNALIAPDAQRTPP